MAVMYTICAPDIGMEVACRYALHRIDQLHVCNILKHVLIPRRELYKHFLVSFIPLCVGCGKGGDDKNANIDDDENDNVGDKMGDEANISRLL